MKISSIAQKCKLNKHALIIDCKTHQFLSNGLAVYKISGLPELSPENIPALFSLSAEDWIKNWTSERISEKGIGISLEDFKENDELTTQPYPPLVVGSSILRCFIGEDSREMIFINSEHLKKLDSDLIEYLIRRTNSGHPVLVAKQGMFTEAIIYPVPIAPKALSDKLHEYASAIAKRCSNYECIEDSLQIQFENDDIEEPEENDD